MSATDFYVTLGSAAVVLLMVGIAWALGFRATARLDEAALTRLAAAEGAHVEAAAVDAAGKAAIARLTGGKLLFAKVMADGVSARILPLGEARVRAKAGKVSVTFGDLGYPSLSMRIDNPPGWLSELGAPS